MGKKKKKGKAKGGIQTVSNEDVESIVPAEELPKYTVDDLLKRVSQYLENFEYELASKFCEKALELEPNNVVVLEMYGNVCAEVGDTQHAREYFLKAVKVEPEIGHVKYLYLGQLSEGQEAVQFYETATKLMNKTMEYNENNIQNADGSGLCKKSISDVYCSLAEIYMTDCCMLENAEELCDKYCKLAVEADKENIDAYIAMCNFLLSKNDIENAKSTATKAFELWEKSLVVSEDSVQETVPYESRITLIKILIEIGFYDKVSQIVDQLIDENEDDIRIWYYLGLAKFLLKDSDNPRFYLEKALELYSKMQYDDEDMKCHIEELLKECPEEDDETMDTIQEDNDMETTDE